MHEAHAHLHTQERKPSVLMDDDDMIITVLRQLALSGPVGLSAISTVNQQIANLSELDVIWRPLCLSRWEPHTQAQQWSDAAHSAEVESDVPVWREQYKARERELSSGAIHSAIHRPS